MITIRVLAFGIARDIVGGAETALTLPSQTTVGELRRQLFEQFPELAKLKSLAIARNNEYAADTDPVSEQDELVLIPPVSGG